MEKTEDEEEDERREAAIASTLALRPDFKPKSNAISQSHLSKFQELHRRRLEIKSKTKFKKKQRDCHTKSHCQESSTKDFKHKDSSFFGSENNNSKDSSFLQQESITNHSAPTQRQKLHWGLDTKERWERKANM